MDEGATRTCSGCRQRQQQRALLRFVADERGRLQLDPLKRLGGRGVYLCPSRRCAEVALRRGALARALRRRVCVPAADGLLDAARAQLVEAASALLSRALRDGRARRQPSSSSEQAAGALGDVVWQTSIAAPECTVVTDERCLARLRRFGQQFEALQGGTEGERSDI